jgi:hypothetical protein
MVNAKQRIHTAILRRIALPLMSFFLAVRNEDG